MTNPNTQNNAQDFTGQEPPFDPDYDQAPPAQGTPAQGTPGDEQPAVDGQQAASGQPAPEQGPEQGQEQEMLGATGDAQDGNLEKDPSEWVSGDDPATEAQKSYIDSLAKQAGEQIPANLTKAEASEHIDRLKKLTGN